MGMGQVRQTHPIHKGGHQAPVLIPTPAPVPATVTENLQIPGLTLVRVHTPGGTVGLTLVRAVRLMQEVLRSA